MPIHYREVQEQVYKAGLQAKDRQKRLVENRQNALDLLHQYSGELEYLQHLVETALQLNPHLRCAVPLSEPLTSSISPLPDLPACVILAADGSQINPSRHDPVAFGLVNVGVFRMEPGSGETPTQIIQSKLIIPDPLSPEDWQLNEQTVALLRDLSEREILAEIVSGEALPTVTLTDGPLEMFRDPQEGRFFQDKFTKYLESLAKVASTKGIPAGYVVKPGSDQTARLLELTQLSTDEYKCAGKPEILAGVIDADLFQVILAPGERSAVFKLQSTTSERYRSFQENLGVCFFYLNTGFMGNPSLARIEIPTWVAEKQDWVELLHTVLVHQCKILGNKPYPYALHRSHEIALVRQEEKDQVLAMIIRELNRQKLELGSISSKQAMKDATRT